MSLAERVPHSTRKAGVGVGPYPGRTWRPVAWARARRCAIVTVVPGRRRRAVALVIALDQIWQVAVDVVGQEVPAGTARGSAYGSVTTAWPGLWRRDPTRPVPGPHPHHPTRRRASACHRHRRPRGCRISLMRLRPQRCGLRQCAPPSANAGPASSSSDSAASSCMSSYSPLSYSGSPG